MNSNPFAPPENAGIEPDIMATTFPDAGNWHRFFNYLIDTTVHSVILIGIEEILFSFYGISTGVLLTLAVFFSYYLLMEGFLGLTIGKLVTGTRVEYMDGGRPSFEKVALRSLCRLVPFEPLSFLASDSRGWHDKWSKTRVVNIRTEPIERADYMELQRL